MFHPLNSQFSSPMGLTTGRLHQRCSLSALVMIPSTRSQQKIHPDSSMGDLQDPTDGGTLVPYFWPYFGGISPEIKPLYRPWYLHFRILKFPFHADSILVMKHGCKFLHFDKLKKKPSISAFQDSDSLVPGKEKGSTALQKVRKMGKKPWRPGKSWEYQGEEEARLIG